MRANKVLRLLLIILKADRKMPQCNSNGGDKLVKRGCIIGSDVTYNQSCEWGYR